MSLRDRDYMTKQEGDDGERPPKPKAWILIVAVVLVALFLLSLWSHAAMSAPDNGLIKEAAQQSESVTYGDFKAGAFREVYDIPPETGTLLSIVPAPGGVTLWFQDDKGNLRNIEVNDTRPLIIHRRGSLTVY